MPKSKSLLSLLLLAPVLITACASTQAPPPEKSGPYMTTPEFANGVAQPALEMSVALGAFYCKERAAPASEEALAAFAGKQGWSRLRSSELSDTPEEVIWKATLASPSSLTESGEIITSWRFALTKTQAAECSLKLSLTPESRFCLKDEVRGDQPDLWAADLLIDLALRAMSKAAKAPAPAHVSSSSAQPDPIWFCFGPSMNIPVAIDQVGGADQRLQSEMVEKKVEERLKNLLRR